MRLVLGFHQRLMLLLEGVVIGLEVVVRLVEVLLGVLGVLMQGLLGVVRAIVGAVDRALDVVVRLLRTLPCLLVVLAQAVGILVGLLMQLVEVLGGGVDVLLDLVVRIVQMLQHVAVGQRALDGGLVFDLHVDLGGHGAGRRGQRQSAGAQGHCHCGDDLLLHIYLNSILWRLTESRPSAAIMCNQPSL